MVNSVAPIRICDIGGWTDTWFAGHGRVLNIAVTPYAEVRVSLYPAPGSGGEVVLNCENYGQRYRLGKPLGDRTTHMGDHPILEAAIESMAIPQSREVEISIYSDVPSGAGTGTSAAVAVALLAALDSLTPGRMTTRELAYLAHHLEVDVLGRESGIQDQLCSACGGINYIEIPSYPEATVSPIDLPAPLWSELERRLSLVFLGRPHDSSLMHEQLIAEMAREGRASPHLDALRHAAELSRESLRRGDLEGLARAMVANTQAQGRLHPGIIGDDAARVIAVARDNGAIGWKVNGAGGRGGSVTLLGGGTSDAEKRALHRAVEASDPACRVIPTTISRHGVRVWRARSDRGRDPGPGGVVPG